MNLAEQHGKEGVITNAYREYVEEAQLENVKYVSCELWTQVCWRLGRYCQYDFHAETKGMKYAIYFVLFVRGVSQQADTKTFPSLSLNLNGHSSPKGE